MPLDNPPIATRTVRLPVDLFHRAQAACWSQARRPAEQIEYWARLGMWLAHNRDLQIPTPYQWNDAVPPPAHPDRIPDFDQVAYELDSLATLTLNRAEWDDTHRDALVQVANQATLLQLNLSRRVPESIVAAREFCDQNLHWLALDPGDILSQT